VCDRLHCELLGVSFRFTAGHSLYILSLPLKFNSELRKDIVHIYSSFRDINWQKFGGIIMLAYNRSLMKIRQADMMYLADNLATGQGGEGVNSMGIKISLTGDGFSLYGQINRGKHKPRTILN